MQFALTTGTCTAAILFAGIVGMPVEGLVLPIGATIGLLLFARYYRHEPSFVLVAQNLAMLVSFTAGYCILMYAIAKLGGPLADPFLRGCDASLSLSAGDTIAWTDQRPWLKWLLDGAYFSMIPQTILVIAVLGLQNDQPALSRFMRRFMLTSLITVAIFYFVPAQGSVSAGDIRIPDYYTVTLQHLNGLRDGSMNAVNCQTAEGLITFPSFHAIWAVLLASAFIGRKLFIPMAVLNAAVLVSTVTTGMHYWFDILGGLLICAIVIPWTRSE